MGGRRRGIGAFGNVRMHREHRRFALIRPLDRRRQPRRHPLSRALTTGVLAGLLSVAADSTPARETAYIMPAKTVVDMPDSARSPVVVTGRLAELRAVIERGREPRAVRVRYVVRNHGDAPLAVFDRGSNRAPLPTGGAAVLLGEAEGATLAHYAQALPEPAPTMPTLALAAKLDAGGGHVGVFDIVLPAQTPSRDAHGAFALVETRRVRYCVGVAPFHDGDFRVRQDGTWLPTLRAIGGQERLCTPWFDLASARFEGV